MISLLIKEISDSYLRENFQRIANYIARNPLDGFALVTGDFTGAETKNLTHGLGFIPQDVLTLRAEGTGSVKLNYDKFTAQTISVSVTGPVSFRALVGTAK